MEVVGYIVAGVLLVVSLFLILMVLKNKRTYECHMIICNAIYKYQIDMGFKNCLVEYDDMCTYDESFRRAFDWGYKHILPPDKYRIIKPYIGK